MVGGSLQSSLDSRHQRINQGWIAIPHHLGCGLFRPHLLGTSVLEAESRR